VDASTRKKLAALEKIREALLDIRVAVWDVVNLVPVVHSPQAHRRLRYAIRKLNQLLRAK